MISDRLIDQIVCRVVLAESSSHYFEKNFTSFLVLSLMIICSIKKNILTEHHRQFFFDDYHVSTNEIKLVKALAI